MTDAMALSFIANTRSEPSDGSMRMSACGRMMVRIACAWLMPSANAAEAARLAAEDERRRRESSVCEAIEALAQSSDAGVARTELA